MSVSSAVVQNGPYVLTGGADVLPYTFLTISDSDIEVFYLNGAGEEILISDTDYTVVPNYSVPLGRNIEGGTVVYGGLAGRSIYLRASPDRRQLQSWSNQGSRLAKLNEGLDRLTLASLVNRSGLVSLKDFLLAAIAEAGSGIGLIGKVDKIALALGTGAALVGWTSPVAGSVGRTVKEKLDEAVYSLYDIGASPASSAAVNTAKVQAALYSGKKNILVPVGTWQINAAAFGDGVNLRGEGWGSCLKQMDAANVDFLSILNVTNCSVENLCIDGNRTGRTGGFVATGGAAVRVINTEIAATPRINNVQIRNCLIINAGFVGVFMNNAHNVLVDGNVVIGDTDTAIAACVGSSNVVISNNICTGFSFGVSLSSDGNADLATTGPVRNITVTGNILNNTKAGGYGIQGDGLDTFTMSGNIINMLGGQYGFRFYNSRGLGIAGAVDVYSGAVVGNVVNYVGNVAGAAFDVTGTGDFRNVAVSGLSVRSATTLANGVYGINVGGGVSATISDFSLENMGYGINVNQNNVAGCKATFREGRVRTARVAVEGSTNTHANKCEMVFENVEITGGVDANFSIANGINLTLINTPVVGTNYMSENSRTGVGLPVRGTAAPTLNAEYIGQIFIDTTTPKQYMAKAIGTGATDWLALN